MGWVTKWDEQKASTWSVNNEETRQLECALLPIGPQSLCAFEQSIPRNIGGTDLLCDTTSFTILHVGAPDIIQDLGFACDTAAARHDILYHAV